MAKFIIEAYRDGDNLFTRAFPEGHGDDPRAARVPEGAELLVRFECQKVVPASCVESLVAPFAEYVARSPFTVEELEAVGGSAVIPADNNVN